ncbi:MAG: hypothetical protein R3Y64_09370 [Peptostreptococcaceae bacterium]
MYYLTKICKIQDVLVIVLTESSFLIDKEFYIKSFEFYEEDGLDIIILKTLKDESIFLVKNNKPLKPIMYKNKAFDVLYLKEDSFNETYEKLKQF